MDMTREALQYIAGLKKAEVIEINGENYTDKEVYIVDLLLSAAPIKIHTLTGLL